MKVVQTVTEVENNGLEALLGKHVQIWCVRYIYAGILKGVNKDDILLEDARVVYETGPLAQATEYTDAQPTFNGILRIRTAAIESYGEGPKK